MSDTLCETNSYCCDSNIDECETDKGKCVQTCVNTNGSYQCSSKGFELTDDKHSCTDEQIYSMQVNIAY